MLVLFNISVLYMKFSSQNSFNSYLHYLHLGGLLCGLIDITITNKMFDQKKKFTKRGQQIGKFLRRFYRISVLTDKLVRLEYSQTGSLRIGLHNLL